MLFRGSVLSKTLKGAGGPQAGGRLTPQGGGHGPLVGGEVGAGLAQPKPGDEKWTKVLDLNRAGAAMDAETFTQVSRYHDGHVLSFVSLTVYNEQFKNNLFCLFRNLCRS